jgi:aromatic-L-amino-acid decarboxylase
VVEQQAVRWIGEFVGFPVASGAFTSGGTISNLTALAAARERALPGSRHAGLGDERPVVYCSEEVHYSVTRAVELLGIGSDRLRAIPLDPLRRLRPDLLAEAIAADRVAGETPVAVVASAGTTLTGAVDDLDAVADACEEAGVWLHVDGAYGLPAAAVRPELFEGLARADSCSVDAHKWLYLPKACGVVMSRHREVFEESFSHEQGYLPHQQHELHAADITLEYSRPFRALKAWLAFRAHGAHQFRDAIARNLEEADLLYRRAQSSEDFEVMDAPPQLSIVPFRHAPVGVAVDAHNERLADAILADGRIYLASALIDGEVWLRPCFVNFRTTDEDVEAILDVARELGSKLISGAA